MSIHQFTPKQSKAENAENLWQAYVNAATQAQKSRRIEDGIIAGKAWAAFMGAFEH